MPNLPFDCIANVINQIDCRHDLFTLLTVSRDVFQMAAQRLYRDPLQGGWRVERRRYDSRVSKLLRLLLSLSPANDHQTNRLRRALNKDNASTSTLSPTTTTTTTMLDYLSLVKVVHWGALLHNHRFSMDMTQEIWRAEDIISTLTWAFVGHRLEKVVELDIMDVHLRDDDDIQRNGQSGQSGGGGSEGEENGPIYPPLRDRSDDRYLRHVSRMTSLRKIWICRSDSWSNDWNPTYSRAEKMILAMQREHGPQQLQECRLTPNPLENGPRVDEGLYTPNIDISGAHHIYSLVSKATGGLAPNQYPTNSPLAAPCSDGSFVALDRLFDPDLARIQSSCDSNDYPNRGMNFHPEFITRLYSDLSDAQILQRYRGLTTLQLYPSAAHNDCFAWAAYEAEYRRRMCLGGARPLVLAATAVCTTTTTTSASVPVNSSITVAPLVALRSLTLDFGRIDPNFTLKPLWDGLQGFSATLEWLKVSCPPVQRHLVSEKQQQEPRVLRSPVPLPRLKRLDLEEVEIDPAFWKLAPRIAHVQIRVLSTCYTTAAATPGPLGNTQEMVTTTTTTSADATAEDQDPFNFAMTTTAAIAPKSAPADVVLDCPMLRNLKLEKGAVHLFDAASFKTSGQCLQQLTMTVACPWETSHITSDSEASRYCHHCCKCSSLDRMASAGNQDEGHSDGGSGDKVDDGALYVRYPDRWTWDWHLPQLTHLYIHGDLLALRFDFVSLLRSCPSIVDINLGHVPARCQLQDNFPLAVKDQVLGIGAAAAVETDAGAGTHVHVSTLSSSPQSPLSVPSVQALSLSGKWFIQAAELACLLNVFLPGLRNLHLHNHSMEILTVEGIEMDCRSLADLTRNHPALGYCLVDTLAEIEQVLQQHQSSPIHGVDERIAKQLASVGLTPCDRAKELYRETHDWARRDRMIVHNFGLLNLSYHLERRGVTSQAKRE